VGLAGAAAGAQDVLQQLLATKRAEFLQQQALQMRQAEQQQQNEQFAQSMGLRNREFDAGEVERAADREYRTGQTERQGRLDAITASDRANAQGTRTLIGDFLTQRRPGQSLSDTERGSLEAMAVTDKIDLPASLTAKPQRRVVTTIGPRGGPVAKLVGDDELEQGVPEYRAPTGGSSDDLVRVETVEGGKRVIKFLPKSQVRGQTFDAPSGGPTIASGQQRKVLNYYNRMKDGLSTAEQIEPAIAGQGAIGQVQGQIAPNFAQTGTQQTYRQAQRSFTEARLRKESGAAIPTHEYDNDAKTYFFQPGDTPEVTAQKKQKRQALLESTAFEAGPAYEEFYGEPFARTGGGDKGGKPITRAQLRAIAAKNGVSEAEAEAQAKAQGYTVQ
jgi:hypothetical protein